MAGIVPTRAVSSITNIFPDALDGRAGNFPMQVMASIKGVLAIVAKVPEELLVLTEEDYVSFVVALSDLEIISEWLITKGKPEPELKEPQPAWNYGSGENPVGRIVMALKKCPDEYPPPESKALLFVDDVALRDSIRNDVGAVDRAITNNEWKAATVFSGSAIEACYSGRFRNTTTMTYLLLLMIWISCRNLLVWEGVQEIKWTGGNLVNS
jgi:hypothetical protein